MKKYIMFAASMRRPDHQERLSVGFHYEEWKALLPHVSVFAGSASSAALRRWGGRMGEGYAGSEDESGIQFAR